ncbi:MAG: hypothetical protein ACPGRE_07755 [Flavobacteriaceae bacterium]
MKVNFLLLICISLFTLNHAKAQFAPEKNKEEPHQEYLLPLFGYKVVKMGHTLPKPIGFMFNYVWQKSEITIEDFRLGTSPDKLADFSWVGFSNTISTSNVINVRLDAWLFPFLNVYGIYARSSTVSTESVTFPINFPIRTTPTANTYGAGLVLAYGWRNYWMTTNANWSFSHTSALTNTVKNTIVSVRLGKQWELNPKSSFSINIGMQYQHLDPRSNGQVSLEAVQSILDNPEMHEAIQQIESGAADWYNGLSFAQKKVVDQVIDMVQDKTDGLDPNIPDYLYFSLNKYRVSKYSGLLGISYFNNRRHMLRLEGALGPSFTNFQLTYNYRFGFHKSKSKKVYPHLY